VVSVCTYMCVCTVGDWGLAPRSPAARIQSHHRHSHPSQTGSTQRPQDRALTTSPTPTLAGSTQRPKLQHRLPAPSQHYPTSQHIRTCHMNQRWQARRNAPSSSTDCQPHPNTIHPNTFTCHMNGDRLNIPLSVHTLQVIDRVAWSWIDQRPMPSHTDHHRQHSNHTSSNHVCRLLGRSLLVWLSGEKSEKRCPALYLNPTQPYHGA
jgi:hypothetical protein